MSIESALEALLDADDIHDLAADPQGKFAICLVRKATSTTGGANAALWRLDVSRCPSMTKLTLPGKNPRNPRLSRSGEQLAFVATVESGGVPTQCLFVCRPDGSHCLEIARSETDIAGLSWAPNSESLRFVAWTEVTPAEPLDNIVSRRTHDTLNKDTIVTEQPFFRSWDRFLPTDGFPSLYAAGTDGKSLVNLMAESLLDMPRWGASEGLYSISPSTCSTYFVYDRSRTKQYGGALAIGVVRTASTPPETLLDSPDESYSDPSVSPDGSKLAFLTTVEIDGRATKRCVAWAQLDSDVAITRLHASEEIDWQAPIRWTADSSALLVCGQKHGRQHLWKIDCHNGQPKILVAGGWVTAFDVDTRDNLVLLMNSHHHPTRVYSYATGSLTRIDEFNNALPGSLPNAENFEVWIEGARGDAIQIWVTRPVGRSVARLPVFLHLHGGPHVAVGDSWNYRWNRNLFASQGYAVVSPNFHGSTGFGFEFKDSIAGRWGELELLDVEATTKWIEGQSWADSSRIFAGGGSYGGTIAAWLNGISGKLPIQALVCHGGIFDWSAMMAQDVYVQQRKALGAWPWQSGELLRRQSPSSMARHFRTPTLILHAQNDFRVPDAQGLAYYATLQALQVPSRLVWFRGDNHRIGKRENNRTWWNELFCWLNRFSG